MPTTILVKDLFCIQDKNEGRKVYVYHENNTKRTEMHILVSDSIHFTTKKYYLIQRIAYYSYKIVNLLRRYNNYKYVSTE